MLQNGYPAPNFSLPDQSGRKFSLTELLKEGPIILYFYPADFTAGCTKEACNFRDQYPAITQKGIRVVGISPQAPETHAKFREKYNLPFTLLSDEQKTTIADYEALGPLGLIRRITYFIAKDGIVKDAVTADIRIAKHATFAENCR